MIRLLGVPVVVSLAACGSVSVRNDAGTDGAVAGDDTGGMADAGIDAPPAPTPRLRWTFENNTNNSGMLNGYAFATPNNVGYVAGKVGQAVSFSGSQYANVPGIRAVLGTYPKVTIGFWVREPGTLGSQSVFDVLNRTSAPYGGVQVGFATNMGILCAASTTHSLLGGSCQSATGPSANVFHHWILRYDGTSATATNGGAPVDLYVDGNSFLTQANASSEPVFSSAIPDVITIGTAGVALDELVIYDQVFDLQTQCTQIVGGTFANGTCTPP